MNVVVIGAGIVGVTTAFELARDGHAVTVIERRADAALETSRANAGLLVPTQAAPWNEPGIGRQALRFLTESEAMLVVSPRLEPFKWAWLTRFLFHSAPARHAAALQANLALARYTRTLMDERAAEHAIAFDRTTRGILTLVRAQDDVAAAERAALALRRQGNDAQMVDRASALALEPALQPIAEQVQAAIHTPEDHSGDIHRFTRAMVDVARARGVCFRFDTNVVALERAGTRIAALRLEDGEVATPDIVVLAAGSASRDLARPVGLALPIYPVQGCSVTFDLPSWPGRPAMPVRDRRLKVAITPLGPRLRVAGMAILDGASRPIAPHYVERMRRAMFTLFPEIPREAPATAWSGWRPMTPDGPPLIGPTWLDNLFVNAGHGALGWTLSCGSARLLSDAVARRASAIDRAPFAIDRYRNRFG